MNEITTVGVDLAKEVIVVCAGDASGRVRFFKQLSFAGFAEWVVNLPPCTIGMEACSSAHHWGRFVLSHGHTPKLMAAEFVKPFGKSKGAKNDRNDAQAILTAMLQPEMRFVSVKSIEQQAVLACHRMRQGWNMERTALINRTRGLLAEFGFWLGRSSARLMDALPRLIQEEDLPARLRTLLSQALEHLQHLDAQIERCQQDVQQHARHSEGAQRISAITGIGPITASAVICSSLSPDLQRNVHGCVPQPCTTEPIRQIYFRRSIASA